MVSKDKFLIQNHIINAVKWEPVIQTSAHVNIGQSMVVTKSFINKTKNRGPRLGLCGTPDIDTNIEAIIVNAILSLIQIRSLKANQWVIKSERLIQQQLMEIVSNAQLKSVALDVIYTGGRIYKFRSLHFFTSWNLKRRKDLKLQTFVVKFIRKEE